VLITCWSSKGGSGTTVVAAALAHLLAAEASGALLVDLGGDLPAALGLPEPYQGLTGWVEGGDLNRLAVEAGPDLRLLPRGPGPLADGSGLAAALAGQGAVVVDAGVLTAGGLGLELALAATTSLLVVRPCFLALRRAVAAPLRPSGVVLVEEPHRALGRSDVEAALGIPVVAVVPWDPAVARRVDAGLLGTSLPRTMARALRGSPWGRGWRPSPPTPLPVVGRPSAALRLLGGGASCGPSVGGEPPTPPAVAVAGRRGPAGSYGPEGGGQEPGCGGGGGAG